MGGHVSALQHLSESTEGADDTLDNLEGRLRALSKALHETLLAAHTISAHAIRAHAVHSTTIPSAHPTISTVHAAHPAHGPHRTIAAS